MKKIKQRKKQNVWKKTFDNPYRNIKSIFSKLKYVIYFVSDRLIYYIFIWWTKTAIYFSKIVKFKWNIFVSERLKSYPRVSEISLSFTFAGVRFYISLFLKLTVHSTYTEKLQINEQIKLYTIYTSTVNRQMELNGRRNYHIYISNKFT
jgi:hypothetical protein